MNRWYQFVKTAEFPPTDFQPESSDLIYAYAVFSHLSGAGARAGARRTQPSCQASGIVVVTSFPRRSPKNCVSWADDKTKSLPEGQRQAAISLRALANPLAAYRGEFSMALTTRGVDTRATPAFPRSTSAACGGRISVFSTILSTRNGKNAISCRKV